MYYRRYKLVAKQIDLKKKNFCPAIVEGHIDWPGGPDCGPRAVGCTPLLYTFIIAKSRPFENDNLLFRGGGDPTILSRGLSIQKMFILQWLGLKISNSNVLKCTQKT